MVETTKERSATFLFALNIFIAFLLLFEGSLAIPEWLQPVGRMHPSVLHFPIVLLLLAMAMEVLRFRKEYQDNTFYRQFASVLFLTGVISAGLTVIMGIFLSREGGYDPSVLVRHKWSGATVYYLASFMYGFRDARWYPRFARGAALVTTIGVLLAGHFGGTLTHGENFVWQPVLNHEPVAVRLEEAILFDHVIKPILDQKCVACHNADKLKGQLMLTDSASMMRGGKTGELIIPGKPGESLMLRRLALPLEEKKHMPPSGKPQLTDEEHELLYRWIKAGSPFHVKVTSLAEGDSLKLLATALLEREEREEVFPFPAPDPETVRKLNSDFRVVTLVSQNSPALAVNVYNRGDYSSRTLDELKDVGLQVLSLDVSNMPVTDADVKYILRMENLRRLNLNFTDITNDGLLALTALQHLESLSLAGTKIDYDAVAKFIPQCRNLRSIAVWETDLSDRDTENLSSRFRDVTFLYGIAGEEQPPIKLNPPRLGNRSLVFADSIALELVHSIPGVDIRFTTDGSDPDSSSSPSFRSATFLHATTAIRARAFKKGWLSSDPATLNVYRSAARPDTAILGTRLNRVHTASGAATFFDHQLGTFNANSPAWANNWGGVMNNDLVLLLEYDTPRDIRSVALNSLIETENFIFPPASIEIWGGDDKETLALLHRCRPDLPGAYRKPYIQVFECSFRPQRVSYLRLVVSPVMKLPAWHRRGGRPALLLVDEILVN